MYAIKKMMVEKQILQKEYALRQNLMNLKMFFLIKKLLDIKSKEFKRKNIKQEPMKLTKYHYHVLMIKVCIRWQNLYACLFS